MLCLQSVDTEKEEIYLQSTRTIGASDLEGLISSERAGYHLFNYAHRYNGEDISSIGKQVTHFQHVYCFLLSRTVSISTG